MPRTYTHDTRIEFDAPLLDETGTEWDDTIRFTRRASIGREYYGADADGRRGRLEWMVDADEAEDIEVDLYPDGGSAFTTVPLASLGPVLRAKVVAAVEAYMQKHDACEDIPTVPEPDYDAMRDAQEDR